jgi:hypothetical protein
MDRADNRGAALARTSRPDSILPNHVLRPGKHESRRLPRITQRDALTECLRSISQWSSQALGIPGAACFAPVSARQIMEQIWLVLSHALKRLP